MGIDKLEKDNIMQNYMYPELYTSNIERFPEQIASKASLPTQNFRLKEFPCRNTKCLVVQTFCNRAYRKILYILYLAQFLYNLI